LSILARESDSSADAECEDIALAVGGDAVAFERLYRRHVGKVAALARWLVGSGGSEVEDAVQDVFVRVWQKLGTFAGESSFSTWLHRVAVNLLLRRRQTVVRHQTRISAEPDALGLVPTRRDHPELRLAIEHAVGQLPSGAREVFVLHDMEGYKHEEIGRMLEIDPGTSRSQLHRARMMLRRCLGS
jgi:RNA polymerase sigma-70 factor (ECF subfamily)